MKNPKVLGDRAGHQEATKGTRWNRQPQRKDRDALSECLTKPPRPGDEGTVSQVRKNSLSLHSCLGVTAPAVTGEPVLGLLQLLRALDGVRLVFGPPLGHLAVGLGQRPLQLCLCLLLLLILFPQQVTVVAGGLQGVGQGVLGLWESRKRRTPVDGRFGVMCMI